MGFRRRDRQDLAVLGLCAWALWALGPVLHLAAHEGAHLHAAVPSLAHSHAHAHAEGHPHAHPHPHEEEAPAGHTHGAWDPSHLGVVSTPVPPPLFMLAALVEVRADPARSPAPPSLRRWHTPVMAQAP